MLGFPYLTAVPNLSETRYLPLSIVILETTTNLCLVPLGSVPFRIL